MKNTPHGSSRRLRVMAIALAVTPFGAASITCAAALAQPASDTRAPAGLKAFLASSLPADAQEVVDIVEKSNDGQTVTLRGYIPGTGDAFSAEVAEFALAPAPSQAAGPRVTVRLTDAAGATLRGGLSGQHGLKAGAEVFVTGKVLKPEGAQVTVVSATSMHIPRSPMPTGFFVEKPDAKAVDISEVRKAGTLKAGDTVALVGRIGGSRDPFVAGRAIVTLVGRGLKACADNPEDSCATPWDYCCETSADILANQVTVQVVDGKSQVLRTDLKGRHGLKELSEVVVVGTVSVATPKAVVINATSMCVSK